MHPYIKSKQARFAAEIYTISPETMHICRLLLFTYASSRGWQAKMQTQTYQSLIFFNPCIEGNNYGPYINNYPTKSLPRGRLTSTVTLCTPAGCCGHLSLLPLQYALQLPVQNIKKNNFHTGSTPVLHYLQKHKTLKAVLAVSSAPQNISEGEHISTNMAVG